MKILWLLVFLMGTKVVHAELGVQSLLGLGEDTGVIEESYFANLSLEEPVFAESFGQRSLSSQSQADDIEVRENDGHLQVLSEIPYSYSWTSRAKILSEVLAEIEEEKSKKSQ